MECALVQCLLEISLVAELQYLDETKRQTHTHNWHKWKASALKHGPGAFFTIGTAAHLGAANNTQAVVLSIVLHASAIPLQRQR